jgi:hypothetical protein
MTENQHIKLFQFIKGCRTIHSAHRNKRKECRYTRSANLTIIRGEYVKIISHLVEDHNLRSTPVPILGSISVTGGMFPCNHLSPKPTLQLILRMMHLLWK